MNLKKIIALGVSIVFLFNIAAQPVYGSSIPGPLSSYKLNQNFTVNYFNGTSDNIVMLVQDLHCHYDTQNKIAQLLQSISQNVHFNKIYAEGLSENVNDNFIKNLPENIKVPLIESLFKENRISGAEYFFLKTDKNTPVYALEDEKLYKDNGERLAYILSTQREVGKIIRGMEHEIKDLRRNKLTNANKKLFSVLLKYENGKINQRGYYKYLYGQAEKLKISFDNYPNFIKFANLPESINYKKANKELKNWMETAKNTLPYSVYSALMQSEVYENVLKTSKDYSIDMSQYPELAKSIAAYEYANNTDFLKLYNEETHLINQVFIKNTRNDETEAMVLSLAFEKLKKFMANKATDADYRYIEEFSFDYFEELWANNIGGLTFNNLSEYIEMYNTYYDANNKRNIEFANRIESGINKKSKNITVAITGGFHTEELKQLLLGKGFGVAVLTPKISGGIKQAEKQYIKYFNEQFHAKTASAMLGAYQLELFIQGKPNELLQTLGAAHRLHSTKAFGSDTLEDVLQKIVEAYNQNNDKKIAISEINSKKDISAVLKTKDKTINITIYKTGKVEVADNNAASAVKKRRIIPLSLLQILKTAFLLPLLPIIGIPSLNNNGKKTAGRERFLKLFRNSSGVLEQKNESTLIMRAAFNELELVTKEKLGNGMSKGIARLNGAEVFDWIIRDGEIKVLEEDNETVAATISQISGREVTEEGLEKEQILELNKDYSVDIKNYAKNVFVVEIKLFGSGDYYAIEMPKRETVSGKTSKFELMEGARAHSNNRYKGGNGFKVYFTNGIYDVEFFVEDRTKVTHVVVYDVETGEVVEEITPALVRNAAGKLLLTYFKRLPAYKLKHLLANEEVFTVEGADVRNGEIRIGGKVLLVNKQYNGQKAIVKFENGEAKDVIITEKSISFEDKAARQADAAAAKQEKYGENGVMAIIRNANGDIVGRYPPSKSLTAMAGYIDGNGTVEDFFVKADLKAQYPYIPVTFKNRSEHYFLSSSEIKYLKSLPENERFVTFQLSYGKDKKLKMKMLKATGEEIEPWTVVSDAEGNETVSYQSSHRNMTEGAVASVNGNGMVKDYLVSTSLDIRRPYIYIAFRSDEDAKYYLSPAEVEYLRGLPKEERFATLKLSYDAKKDKEIQIKMLKANGEPIERWSVIKNAEGDIVSTFQSSRRMLNKAMDPIYGNGVIEDYLITVDLDSKPSIGISFKSKESAKSTQSTYQLAAREIAFFRALPEKERFASLKLSYDGDKTGKMKIELTSVFETEIKNGKITVGSMAFFVDPKYNGRKAAVKLENRKIKEILISGQPIDFLEDETGKIVITDAQHPEEKPKVFFPWNSSSSIPQDLPDFGKGKYIIKGSAAKDKNGRVNFPGITDKRNYKELAALVRASEENGEIKGVPVMIEAHYGRVERIFIENKETGKYDDMIFESEQRKITVTNRKTGEKREYVVWHGAKGTPAGLKGDIKKGEYLIEGVLAENKGGYMKFTGVEQKGALKLAALVKASEENGEIKGVLISMATKNGEIQEAFALNEKTGKYDILVYKRICQEIKITNKVTGEIKICQSWDKFLRAPKGSIDMSEGVYEIEGVLSESTEGVVGLSFHGIEDRRKFIKLGKLVKISEEGGVLISIETQDGKIQKVFAKNTETAKYDIVIFDELGDLINSSKINENIEIKVKAMLSGAVPVNSKNGIEALKAYAVESYRQNDKETLGKIIELLKNNFDMADSAFLQKTLVVLLKLDRFMDIACSKNVDMGVLTGGVNSNIVLSLLSAA